MVVSSGTPSRGLGGRRTSESSAEDMVARLEGPSGGRVCEEKGSRSGVDMVEFRVEGGRTRFARRKKKNAALVLNPGTWLMVSRTGVV